MLTQSERRSKQSYDIGNMRHDLSQILRSDDFSRTMSAEEREKVSAAIHILNDLSRSLRS